MSRNPEPRKALGRGLATLLPGRNTEPAPPPTLTDHLASLPIELIDPNPVQPRTVFQPKALEELADSIRANGIIQPLIVRRKQDRFELVAGERRWRAARLIGLKQVPAVIQDIANDRVLELAIIENLQREDLNPIETAQAFERLATEFNLTHEEIAKRTGKDRSTITNLLRLLRLPAEIQIMLAEHRLSMGHARAILGLPTEEQQRQVADRTVAEGLSVRSVERMVQHLLEPREPKESKADILAQDPNVRAAIQELERVLGTRVRIVPQTEKRGRIEIEYYSAEDLDRIYTQIVGDQEGGAGGRI